MLEERKYPGDKHIGHEKSKKISWRLDPCLCVAKPANIWLRYDKTSIFLLHAVSCYQISEYELFYLEETFRLSTLTFSLLLLSALPCGS